LIGNDFFVKNEVTLGTQLLIKWWIAGDAFVLSWRFRIHIQL